MSNVVDFGAHVKNKFNEDFKKRWKAKGSAGTHTDGIWAMQEELENAGWKVDLHNDEIGNFHTYVDIDKKLILNCNIKAYHADLAMQEVCRLLEEMETGRFVLHWQEVHDDEHRRVREGAGYEDLVGTPDYGSVWYSRELFLRVLADTENYLENTAIVEYPFYCHTQTLKHDPANGVNGNCQQTVFACLLGLDIADVPHFGEGLDFSNREHDIVFHNRYQEFLDIYDLREFTVAYNSEVMSLDDVLRCTSTNNPNIPLIIGVQARPGVNHSVIAYNGKIVHDPLGKVLDTYGPLDIGVWSVSVLVNINQAYMQV